ncbi:zinc finger protein 628-like [Pollicipes pollicipes]|uniref:zinc finger protein 628-like n=1 Tax=Pollicipes pollicipes TaxID=41117 RepID=UPI001885109C|nr:zinc finger protein 628-like [Pollicipes pollicipes]
MPPPTLYPGFGGGPPSGPDSPGDKSLRPGQAQHCKRPKTYLCEICDKKFTSMGHLKRHFNTIVHRQAKDGKRSGGPGAAKAKQRPRPGFGEPAAAPPPLVSMASGMYGMAGFPASGPPPPQYPMTPPMQESPAPPSQPSPTPILAPPPQTLGYAHQVAPEYQVSVATAPNPQPLPTSFHGAYSAAGMPYGFGSYQPVYSQAGPPPQQPQPPPQQPQPPPPPLPAPPAQPDDGDGGDAQSEGAASPGSASGSGQSSEDSELSEEPFVCCNKRFSSLQYYKLHRESQHNGERLTKCAQCGRRHRPEVSCQEYDRTHRRRHQCDTCDKEFTHFSDLKRHKYTHLTEKPFICQQCGKGFIRKDQMEKHMPTHEAPPASPQQSWSPHPGQAQAAFSGTTNGNTNGHLMQPSF